MNGPPLTPALWAAAFAPVATLFALVASGRVRTQRAAAVVLVVTAALGLTAFRAGPAVLLLAAGKGLWLGAWILLVVWPALLLYRLAEVGGLERIGKVFVSILPRRRENLLIVSWLFPAFIQGVAGFGTPIAVAAPLLVAMGWSRTRAVVYPLIGYHWAVTFGSMGSSFYMASLTAHLSPGQQVRFAVLAASVLGVNCLLSGALVLFMDGRWTGLREGGRVLVLAGVPMAVTQVVTAYIVPAVASLAAGATGFLAVFAMAARHRRRQRAAAPVGIGAAGAATGRVREGTAVAGAGPPGPDRAPVAEADDVHPAQLLSPYLYLLALALPVFLVPASRAWVRAHLLLALDFPATTTGWGWATEAAPQYTPVAVLGHPGSYISLACLLGYLTYRWVGLWGATNGRAVLRKWARSLPRASTSIVQLAVVATILIDTGMVAVLARGVTGATGEAFPLLSPVVGAMGSFMTGSTTSANALFSSLQTQVAGLLDIAPEVLLTGQTVGGNVGNSVAPVIILIGVTAVGVPDQVSRILRISLVPCAVLLAGVSAMVLVLSRLVHP